MNKNTPIIHASVPKVYQNVNYTSPKESRGKNFSVDNDFYSPLEQSEQNEN